MGRRHAQGFRNSYSRVSQQETGRGQDEGDPRESPDPESGPAAAPLPLLPWPVPDSRRANSKVFSFTGHPDPRAERRCMRSSIRVAANIHLFLEAAYKQRARG